MQEHGPDSSTFFWKIAIYVGGLVIGITAKLATLYEQDKLNFKKFFLHTSLALSSAWIVYFFLDSRGLSSWMPIAGPLIGRFGDYVLIAIWKMVKERIINSEKKDEEIIQ